MVTEGSCRNCGGAEYNRRNEVSGTTGPEQHEGSGGASARRGVQASG